MSNSSGGVCVSHTYELDLGLIVAAVDGVCARRLTPVDAGVQQPHFLNPQLRNVVLEPHHGDVASSNAAAERRVGEAGVKGGDYFYLLPAVLGHHPLKILQDEETGLTTASTEHQLSRGRIKLVITLPNLYINPTVRKISPWFQGYRMEVRVSHLPAHDVHHSQSRHMRWRPADPPLGLMDQETQSPPWLSNHLKRHGHGEINGLWLYGVAAVLPYTFPFWGGRNALSYNVRKSL